MRLTDEQVQKEIEFYEAHGDGETELCDCLTELLELRKVVAWFPRNAAGTISKPGTFAYDAYGRAYIVPGTSWAEPLVAGSPRQLMHNLWPDKEAALAARTLANAPHDHDHLEEA